MFKLLKLISQIFFKFYLILSHSFKIVIQYNNQKRVFLNRAVNHVRDRTVR